MWQLVCQLHAEEGQTLMYEDGKYKLYSNNYYRKLCPYISEMSIWIYFFITRKGI